MQDYRKLTVWLKAHRLTLKVYGATHSRATQRHTALISQIRRAAMSVPANIAEGCGKESRRELGRFLEIAIGSATELEYHLVLARDLQLLSDGVHAGLAIDVAEVLRMLVALRRRVRSADEPKSTSRQVNK